MKNRILHCTFLGPVLFRRRSRLLVRAAHEPRELGVPGRPLPVVPLNGYYHCCLCFPTPRQAATPIPAPAPARCSCLPRAASRAAPNFSHTASSDLQHEIPVTLLLSLCLDALIHYYNQASKELITFFPLLFYFYFFSSTSQERNISL